jgi:thioredoxin 1
VEFWQPGCGHCQALLQELELIQAEVGNRLFIVKMNVQENFLIPGEIEIQSLPTLALYVDGKFEQFVGGIGKKKDLLNQLTNWMWGIQLFTVTLQLCNGIKEHPSSTQNSQSGD